MKDPIEVRRCVVTKASDCKTFQKGDHILFYEDGSIGSVEAQGWIEKDEVAESTKGMECVTDMVWVEKTKCELKRRLEQLEELV